MRNEEICPACLAETQHLTDWEYSGLDASIFNYTAKWHSCNNCGLVYVANIDDETLAKFYANECSYFENDHFDITSPANVTKYQHYYNFISNAGLENTPITDIGCGRGGFLQWLNKQGWQAHCIGVDVDIKSMPVSQKNSDDLQISFQTGGALSLPFAVSSQRLLTYFHVLEHIHDLDSVLKNAHNVLMEQGHILIEVPDAENYAQQPIGTAFWMGIREHIYHYSAQSLNTALNLHGFEIVSCQRAMLPTPEFEYPSLMILAQKTEHPCPAVFAVTENIANYVSSAKRALNEQAEILISLAKQHSQLTIWGLSTQLFSLLPKLKGIDYRLCDASKQKQNSHFQQQSIYDPNEIQPEALLVIAPYLHAEKIEIAALSLGWSPRSIHRLQ
ncbi:class I SAM-dependent methyltransferase [Methylophaga nitratireducenticrescens]|uniref:Methyltransferase type 12 n=1 Tax=Methylophaga nitratireducenticrescens TaxID=754476 RepID=I1XLB6_METNJ|nr:class I SAM-dependent methyltransferase [Methylophaga nitratireducenticrescens]